MKCPSCNEHMSKDGEPTITLNQTQRRGRHDQYVRTHFFCKMCDIWLGIEIPQGKATEKPITAAS